MAYANDFEMHLGPARHRYFGDGYRRTRYQLGPLRTHEDGMVVGTASVLYAPDWSVRSGAHRIPHLSSIDAMILGAGTVQWFLIVRGVTREGVARAWISELQIRAPHRPVENLTEVSVRLLGWEVVSAPTAGHRARLKMDIGGFAVQIAVEYDEVDNPLRCEQPVNAELLPQILVDLAPRTEHGARILALSSAEVTCELQPSYAVGGAAGLSSSYWPFLTFIDAIVVGGQLGEILLKRRWNAASGDYGELWMRNILVRIPSPSTLRSHAGVVRIERLRELAAGNASTAAVSFAVAIAAIQIKGEFAYSWLSSPRRASDG